MVYVGKLRAQLGFAIFIMILLPFIFVGAMAYLMIYVEIGPPKEARVKLAVYPAKAGRDQRNVSPIPGTSDPGQGLKREAG